MAEVLCVGELLWDELPDGRVPGGAPFNVAAHLSALGIPAAILTRVGTDAQAAPLVADVRGAGVATDLIQYDPDLATGTVGVTTSPDGQPTYAIREPAAWDAIQVGERERAAARGAAALVFGSLAQRGAQSQESIQALWDTPALKVFDVNLRPPHVDRETIAASLRGSGLVKVNREELREMAEWWELPREPREAAAGLARRFGCRIVCVTAGAAGAGMLREGRWTEHPGFPARVVDTIGAGDAFLAALLRGVLRGEADEVILREANRLGALVASRRGAIPPPADAG